MNDDIIPVVPPRSTGRFTGPAAELEQEPPLTWPEDDQGQAGLAPPDPGREYDGPVALATREASTAPPQQAGPYLVHAGTYALYRTPAGLFHLTYRRTASTDDKTGQVFAIDDAPDVHSRDLPEHAAMMALAIIDRDAQLPPILQQFLLGANPFNGGKGSMIRQMAALAKEGGFDQLLQFAQQQAGGPDDAVE